MRELSLNILDIAENCLKAKAIKVTIEIIVTEQMINLAIKDNGVGMAPEFVKKVVDPFVTTRQTRKVGLGIPLIKMQAEMTGGEFRVSSTEGEGTILSASFGRHNIDRTPLGNIASTMVVLISQKPTCDFELIYEVDGNKYVLNTEEVRKELDGISMDEPEILVFLGEMIAENIQNINGGQTI